MTPREQVAAMRCSHSVGPYRHERVPKKDAYRVLGPDGYNTAPMSYIDALSLRADLNAAYAHGFAAGARGAT